MGVFCLFVSCCVRYVCVRVCCYAVVRDNTQAQHTQTHNPTHTTRIAMHLQPMSLFDELEIVLSPVRVVLPLPLGVVRTHSLSVHVHELQPMRR